MIVAFAELVHKVLPVNTVRVPLSVGGSKVVTNRG